MSLGQRVVINAVIRGQGGVTDFLHQDGAGNSLHIIDYAKLHVLRLMLFVSAALMKWVKKTKLSLGCNPPPWERRPRGTGGGVIGTPRTRVCDSWI